MRLTGVSLGLSLLTGVYFFCDFKARSFYKNKVYMAKKLKIKHIKIDIWNNLPLNQKKSL